MKRTTKRIRTVTLGGGYDDYKEASFLSGNESKPGKSKSAKERKRKEKVGSTRGAVKQLLDGFNARETKGNLPNTLLKTLVDTVGVGLGTVLSAATGKVAPLAGIALIGAGHYTGDKTGLLRIVGATTLAHSVAKAKEYREHPEMTLSERLKGVKDGWLYAALLKHYTPQQQPDLSAESSLEGMDAHQPSGEIQSDETEQLNAGQDSFDDPKNEHVGWYVKARQEHIRRAREWRNAVASGNENDYASHLPNKEKSKHYRNEWSPPEEDDDCLPDLTFL